jgi:hypothetical protein
MSRPGSTTAACAAMPPCAGLYLASMDTAAVTCLWLVEKAQQLRKLAPCSQPGASLAWHPQGNSLVVGGQQGGVAVLADVVPVREELPCPWAPPDELLKAADAKRAGERAAAALCASWLQQGPLLVHGMWVEAGPEEMWGITEGQNPGDVSSTATYEWGLGLEGGLGLQVREGTAALAHLQEYTVW